MEQPGPHFMVMGGADGLCVGSGEGSVHSGTQRAPLPLETEEEGAGKSVSHS